MPSKLACSDVSHHEENTDVQCVMFLFLFLPKELFLVASCSGDLRKESIFCAERVVQVTRAP